MARGVRLQFSPAQAEQDLAIQLAVSSVVRRFGPVEQQHAYVPGRQFKADFAIASVRLLIEVQGGITAGRRWRTDPATGQRYQVEARGAHGSVEGVLKDNERLNLATLHGWTVLRFTPGEVATHEAISFIERYLAAVEPIWYARSLPLEQAAAIRAQLEQLYAGPSSAHKAADFGEVGA